MTPVLPPSPYGVEAARAAADEVGRRLGVAAPSVAIILGSGLGDLARDVGNGVRVPFAEIPGFPPATVAGHPGAVIGGTLGGKAVVCLAGRFHLYEGHPAPLAAYPVRVANALGARTLIVSNAAGGLRTSMPPGTLMLISDHINLMWRNPLAGPLEPGDERFPDMSEPFDAGLRAKARAIALEMGLPLDEGVYISLSGPTYETPAEVRMLQRLGGDAVGMSTVPEVLVARALGMRVVGISCITNLAGGLSPVRLSHDEVLEVSAAVGASFRRLVTGLVESL